MALGGDAFAEEVQRWNINPAYVAGYEQAEKDLALTWEDIKRIVNIADDLLPGHDIEHLLSEFQTEEAYYKEVLKKFREVNEYAKLAEMTAEVDTRPKNILPPSKECERELKWEEQEQ